MTFIGNFRNLCTDSRYMSNATLEAAYGLVGLIGSSSFEAWRTEPYISEVPIWMKRSSQLALHQLLAQPRERHRIGLEEAPGMSSRTPRLRPAPRS